MPSLYNRIHEIRRQGDIDKEAMDYPFSFLLNDDYYEIADMLRPIPTEEMQAEPGDFPKNIREYYWTSQGQNDERPWHAIGILDNGNYFYFTASCDYTGFDCQGEMHLWVASSYEAIIEHGLGEEVYQEYLLETREI